MSKAKPYLFGAALGASAMFFSLQYHVVHSHDGFQVIPRTPQQSIGLAYLDIRSWGPSQWTDRPEVARALMAHGSSDLISESVAATLADSVSEDTSTLNELRGFLNDVRTDGKSGDASDIFNSAPGRESDERGFDKSGQGTDDDLRIPFPQDAKKAPLPDPFASRVARSEESLNESTSVSGPRFTTEEVREGLEEPSHDAEVRATRKPSTSANARSEKSIAEQADEMDERIFGKSAPGTATKSAPKAAPKPAAKPAPKPPETESLFEEVSTQLENRAQEALNRAQETLTDKSGSATENASKSSSGYIRDKAAELVPDAAKPLLNGNAAATDTTTPSPLSDFDPFLE